MIWVHTIKKNYTFACINAYTIIIDQLYNIHK